MWNYFWRVCGLLWGEAATDWRQKKKKDAMKLRQNWDTWWLNWDKKKKLHNIFWIVARSSILTCTHVVNTNSSSFSKVLNKQFCLFSCTYGKKMKLWWIFKLCSFLMFWQCWVLSFYSFILHRSLTWCSCEVVYGLDHCLKFISLLWTRSHFIFYHTW